MCDFTVEIVLDDEGKIISVAVPENDETPGLGADLLADTAIFDALVGKNFAEAKIDVKAGVTLTSNAINEALAQAAEDAGVKTGAEGDETSKVKRYKVIGFDGFTVEIALDEEGKIILVSIPENNEVLGEKLVKDTTIFDALVGKDIKEAKIDVVAGVTLTSNAINEALAQAAKEVE